MYSLFPIETSTLIIRRIQEDDFVALFMLLKNRFLARYFDWPNIETIEDIETYYFNNLDCNNENDNQIYRFSIINKNDLRLVGIANLDLTEGKNRLEIAVLPTLWDNGIATQVGYAIAGLLKDNGLPYISAVIDSDNVGAIHLVHKLGFNYCYSYQQIINNKCKALRMYQLNLNNIDDYVFKGYLTLALYHRSFIEKLED